MSQKHYLAWLNTIVIVGMLFNSVRAASTTTSRYAPDQTFNVTLQELSLSYGGRRLVVPVNHPTPPRRWMDAIRSLDPRWSPPLFGPPPVPESYMIITTEFGTELIPFVVENGGTQQEAPKLILQEPSLAGSPIMQIIFRGLFDPFKRNNQPAVFTGGIITDAGELVVRVSAQELNFQTDGPIICQALFQRLAPRAPAYGAQITYAGDRLEIYFDPAYTVTQGGVIFGTTSPSPGSSAMIGR